MTRMLMMCLHVQDVANATLTLVRSSGYDELRALVHTSCRGSHAMWPVEDAIYDSKIGGA